VVTATGQWRCVRCEESGNIYNFLQKLHIDALADTKEADYEDLGTIKNINPASLRTWGFAKSPLTGEWLIPCYNEKDNLANLYRVADMDGKLRPLSTPGCKPHPFGTRSLQKGQTRRFVLEGAWDGLRFYDILNSYRQSGGRYTRTGDPAQAIIRSIGVFAVPGSGTFMDSGVALLAKIEGVLVFDNDYPTLHPVSKEPIKRNGKLVIPGWDGQQKAIEVIQNAKERPTALQQMKWSPTGAYNDQLPKGFDVSDLIDRDGAIGALKFIEDHLIPVPLKKTSPRKTKAKNEVEDVPAIDPIHRDSFDALCADYASELHFGPNMRDALAVSLATVLSTDIRGEQLFFRLLGPPGSGKTTIAEAITAAREFTLPSSIFTGFHSGYIGNGEEREQGDSSLIPKMHGKTVIIKDGDTLVHSPSVGRVLAELRDIYDGTTRATYRNRKTSNHENLRITFLLCGTQQLRQLDRSSLGERFLTVEIMGKESTKPYVAKAIKNAYADFVASMNQQSDQPVDQAPDLIRGATYGYILHMKNTLGKMTPPELPSKMESVIDALAHYAAYMRARVDREGHDMTFRPDVELPTRLAKQFVRLSMCLALVLGRKKVDNEVIRITRKVVTDTCKSFHAEVAGSIYKNPQGLSAEQISLFLGLPTTNVRRCLNDMLEFGIVQRMARANNSGQRGRDVHLFQISPIHQENWGIAWT